MSNEINDVVNNICEKLGTTTDMVIPEFARYMVAENIKNLIIGLILLAFDVVVFKTLLKWLKRRITELKTKHENYDWTDQDFAYLFYVACGILLVLGIGSFLTIIDGLDFVNWVVSPKGAFAKYILSTLKG